MEEERGSESRALRFIDLFCGAGGLTQGFADAGYEPVFALDKDADSISTYQRNHPGVPTSFKSITELTPRQVAELAGGAVDVVVGGPSCQGFSTANRKTRLDDERNDLWAHMLGIVEHLKPRAFLLENVPGMAHWREGHFGHEVLKAFGKLGYTVTEDILLAANYGVPQRRRRLFIVGILGDVPFRVPDATHMGGWRRDTLHLWEAKRVKAGLLPHLSCWETIADLPPLGRTAGVPAGPYGSRLGKESPAIARLLRRGSKTLHDHEARLLSSEHEQLVRHVPQGGTWRDIPPHLLPDRFRGMRRTDSTNLFGRLDPALPSYTINTQYSNVTTGCYTHPYEDRPLSVREGARLQTFPDTYVFTGPVESKYRQVGNAVPPMLASVMASALAEQLLGGEQAGQLHRRPVALRPGPVPPAPPTALTGQRMRKQKRVNTRPEVTLRTALFARGLRYRINAGPLLGLRRKADILFVGARTAVFVDGCFWHGCPIHSRDTKSNTKWWADKIAANKQRDAETNALLAAAGWQVLRIWEHEDPAEAAERVHVVVRARSAARAAG